MYYPKDFKNLKPSKRDKDRKKEWSTTKELLNGLDEFCRESSFHGLKYVRDPKLPFLHKIFWLVIFLLSFVTAIITIRTTVWNIYSSQVEMSFKPKSSPIRDIPFPPVMICSNFPIRKSYLDLDLPGGNTSFRHYSKMVCPNKDGLVQESYNSTLTDEFFDFLNEASIPCNQLLLSCRWNNIEEDCCDMFKPFISPFGRCYIFNSYPKEVIYKGYTSPKGYNTFYDERSQLWDLENGYPDRSASDKVLPLWSELPGQRYGLTVTIMENQSEWQQACNGGETGSMVVISSPIDIPGTSNRVKIPNKHHTLIELYATIIQAGQEIKVVPVQERLCWYQGEVDLKYFEIYSQNNCVDECIIDKSLETCGCATFSYQGVLGTWNKPFCNDVQTKCIDEMIWNIFQIPSGLNDTKKCNCLPSCTSLGLEIQSRLEKVQYPKKKELETKTFNHSYGTTISQLSVYFFKSEFVIYYRKNNASVDNTVSICGGLLGLLLGFSIMSIYEVFYFIILKPLVKLFQK